MKQPMYMDNLPPPSSQLEVSSRISSSRPEQKWWVSPVFFFIVFSCKNFDELRELQPPL
jgi:hypothetical protein